MKEFKGTPGPWSWNGEDYRGDWGWQILVGPSGEGIVIGEQSDGSPFNGLKAHQDIDAALCSTGFNSTPDGAPSVHVRYHNAQLIAAAPDLLEALQQMVERIEYYASLKEAGQPNIEDWAYTYNSGDMDDARAAISKALGEE